MESKGEEDALLQKLTTMIKPDLLQKVVTLKHLKLKEGREDHLLVVLLHVMLCGPRGTTIGLNIGDDHIIIRELFDDFTHRGWLTLCVDAFKIFAPKLADARPISPYFRTHHRFWPSEIDIEKEMKSRRDFFDKR
jgi:hypothetical protein